MTYSKLETEPPLSQCPEPIAIVGMGCRWPGGVRNPSQLWDLLKEQRDGWSEFRADRINMDGFYHPNGQRPGSIFTKGGFLLHEDTRDFDHGFFGITATEAMALDPSQRKLLEVTYEAVESACEPLEKFFGSKTGVFVGNFNNEHLTMQLRDPDHTLPYAVTGGGTTILSNRINYTFNLQGPSLTVDTACSASMYALHLAVTAIRNGDCDAAIAAGANLILGPDNQIFITKLGAGSPTSRCHTFDAAADGYGRAEGFGALYLKKLSDAIEHGDPIRAIVRGTAFNANGKTGGISHPSADGQEAVIRQAYKAAGGLNPNLTGYAELHGTGTPVGDPIEVSAVGRVFSSGRKEEPLLIGSIKPNLGHSEAASAMSQIMKAILAMEYGEIPATIGIKNFNPSIDFKASRTKVVTEPTPWPAHLLRRVSINSFGYGGANAHCILDHPSVVIPGYRPRGFPTTHKISRSLATVNGHGHTNGTNGANGKSHANGHGFAAVDGHANGHTNDNKQANGDYAVNGNGHVDTNGSTHVNGNGHVNEHKQINGNGFSNGSGNAPGNSHVNGHKHANGNKHTEAASISSPEGEVIPSVDWIQPPEFLQTDEAGVRPLTLLSFSAHDETALKASIIALSESLGQFNLSDALYTLASRRSTFSYRAFAVIEAEKVGAGRLDPDIVTFGKAPSSTARRIGFVFTGQGAQWAEMGAKLLDEYAVFRRTISYLDAVLGRLQRKPSWTIEEALREPPTTSLVALLKHWGICPVAAVGHSSGEIAAAYTSGRLKASEAIVLAYFRGQVVATNQRQGLMMAVGQGPAEVRSHLDGIESEVKIAAINSPGSVTLSGEPDAIERLKEKLTEHGVFARVLKTGGNAYHSHHMLALGERYEELATQGLEDVGSITRMEPQNPGLRWVSSVTMKDDIQSASPDYWRRNLESPVHFSSAIEGLARDEPVDLLIEIGPHPALGGPLKQIRSSLEQKGVKLPPCLGSLHRGQHDVVSMLGLAGKLFLSNAPVNLVAVNATEKLQHGNLSLCHGFPCIGMPQYKFSYLETPIYHENRFNREYRLRKHLRHDLLGARTAGGSKTHPQWRNILRMKDLPWLDDHKLLPHPVLPGAAYMTMAIEAVTQLHHERSDAAPISSFKLRQVAINSPLRVEDTELGVETVLDMERVALTSDEAMSQWYKFSIGSIAPNSDVWTQHCTGTICATTTKTQISPDQQLQADTRSRALDIKRWHEKFQTAGLGYGPSFQGLSNLKAYRNTNIAAANVSLQPTADFPNESPYAIHPAALDTCIQLALISCHAGQVENFNKAYVPVLAEEVTVWVPNSSNGEQGWGVATGEKIGLRSLYARAQLYDLSGAPLLDMKELKCVVYDSGLHSSQVTREPYWQPVSRPDIETLELDTARAMFPQQNVSLSTLAALDSMAAHVIASFGHQLRSDSSDTPENHGKFAAWVNAWLGSCGRRYFQDISSEDRILLINKLAIELSNIPEALCLHTLHKNLDRILSGETNSTKVLMEGDLVTRLFRAGISVRGGYTQLQSVVDLLAHKNPRMRILEVGAGSAGATTGILEILGSDSMNKRFHEYVFTDSAGWWLPEAQAKFSGHNGVVYRVFDVLKEPVSQGFEKHSFDLVIAAGCLSETGNTAKALEYLHSLLKPSANLLLLETTRLTLQTELLSRTLTGKWDQEQLCWSQPAWDEVLKECGFSSPKISLEDYAGTEAMTTVMLSKALTVDSDALTGAEQPSKVYLVYRESQPLLARLIASIVAKRGHAPVFIDLMSSDEVPSQSVVVSTVDMDGPALTTRDETYFNAIQSLVPRVSSMVWVAADLSIPGESSIMKGMLRSIAAENMGSKYAFIELDHNAYTSQETAASLVVQKLDELQTSSSSSEVDRECVIREGVFHIERLLPAQSHNEQFRLRAGYEDNVQERPVGSQLPLMARYGTPGVLSSLYFSNDPEFDLPLKDDCVEIQTQAIGLNFKDFQVATAKLDSDKLSTEAAGIVTKLGSAVTSLKVGDRVFGMIPGKTGNYLRSPAVLVSKIPDGMSSNSAASMPIAFFTSLYALKHLASLKKGESVLIQSATGGLGRAAIQVARYLGGEVYATVDSDKELKILLDDFDISASHVFDSRSPSAVGEIMKATGQRGMDVILSSAGGDTMHETWTCVAPLGRFIDVGRTDVLGGGRLGLETFKRNATFSSFDLALIYHQKPSLIVDLMTEMTSLLEQGKISPISRLTTFDISQLETAMGTFSKGLYEGKSLVTFNDPSTTLKVSQQEMGIRFDREASYLLVGCLGGLGRSLAAWMVERGARHLVFLSRSGADKPEAASIVEELAQAGAEPIVVRCSVTDKKTLMSAVEEISSRHTVKGVIHAAMVEGDSFFENTTRSQIHQVLAPKVAGTVNLHYATNDLPLDFFLMTSSIVGTVGTPAQGAYAAANAFQDAFARFRLAQSLPATALSLAPILEVGSISDSVGFQQMLRRNATYGISETEFLQFLEGALSRPSVEQHKSDPSSQAQLITGLEPANFISYLDSGRVSDLVWYGNSRFGAVTQAIQDRAQAYSSTSATHSSSGPSLTARLSSAASPAEKMGIVREAVAAQLAKLLSIEPDDIDSEKPVSRYGVDSLVAGELRNWLMKSFGFSVTLLQLLNKTMKIEDLVKGAVAVADAK
ncbi:Prosolanapyrone synthase [Paramyrothecium foliicola]|nr:Prosolanapyrone synthase [Paramyrothecium foliicola]